MKKNDLFPATLMPDDDWWHQLWPDPPALLHNLGLRPAMQVVDLCCGNGHFSTAICQLVQPGQVWGLDLDRDLLDEACEKCAHLANFTPIHGDARALSKHLKTPPDMVFIANTFHGIPDKAAFADSVYQTLAKHGRFIIINWHRLPREQTCVLGQPRGPDFDLRMMPQQLVDIVQRAGFEHVQTVDVGAYHYAATFERTDR